MLHLFTKDILLSCSMGAHTDTHTDSCIENPEAVVFS